MQARLERCGIYGILLAAVAAFVLWIAPLAAAGPSGGNEPPAFAVPDDEPEDGAAVRVSKAISRERVQPGSRFVIAIIFDHARGWHIHTHDPKPPPEWNLVAIPTTVEPPAVDGLKLANIQWPKPETVVVDLSGTGKNPKGYEVYAGKAIVYVPFLVANDAKPGVREIAIPIGYQACNDKTCQGPVDLTLKFKVTVGDTTVDTKDQEIFAGFDLINFESSTKKLVKFALFGKELTLDPEGAGLILLLAAALLGGFLLNLTPCVLPVIPIKMMGLSHAAGSRGKTLFLGVMMSAGVIAFWIAIGAAISLVKGFTAVNQLFQNPWFSIGIGLFIALMAMGMFGAFAINLPQWVYAVDPKRDTIGGSLVFGVMTAVLSTPCTAPFGGAAMAWAATQEIWITLATFGAIGLGMALPYLLLAAFPQLVKGVPKTGPASELLKQVLGLLMLAVAIFFIGVGLDPKLRTPVDPPIRFHWWIIAAVVVGGMGWMIYRLVKIKVRMVPRALFSLIGVLVACGMVLVARSVTDRGPINWVGYTPERYAQAVKEKKVIVTDFTAEWCLNCKTLEASVLHRPEVVGALNDPNVAAFKVDLTGNNEVGQARLKELQWLGIPLLSIEGPSSREPAKFDTYTPQVVLDTMAKAGFTASRATSGPVSEKTGR